MKRVTFIRHGRSLANEWLSGESSWGSPNFTDPPHLKDSKLNEVGRMQAAREVSILGLVPSWTFSDVGVNIAN
jgi:hypothetical protein